MTFQDAWEPCFSHGYSFQILKVITCLCASHEVTFVHDDRDGILLDWCRRLVLAQDYVVFDNLAEIEVCKLKNRMTYP